MKLIGNLILAILLCIPQVAGAVCVQGECINGHGTAVLSDGSKYVGEFRAGMRAGRGTMTYPDGTEYSGDWLNDKPHGKGRLLSVNRFEYTGEFVNGVRQGQGTLKTVDGKSYEGQWLDDAPSGQGRFIDPGREEFVGQFENGQRNGQGDAAYSDGTSYKGQWADDLPNGQGVKTLADGTQYSGDFKNGLMSGSGIMIMPDGSRIKIHWQNDSAVAGDENQSGEQATTKEEIPKWYMIPSPAEVSGQQSQEPRGSAVRMEAPLQESNVLPEVNPAQPPEITGETAEQAAPQVPEVAVESTEQVSSRTPESAVEAGEQVPLHPSGDDSTPEEKKQMGKEDEFLPRAAENNVTEAAIARKEDDEAGSRKGYVLYAETTHGVRYASLAKGANIRSGPALTSGVLRTAPAGYPLAVLQQQEDWFLVQDFRERKGWVYGDLLADPGTVIIKVYKGNLRDGPSLTADVIRQLDYGTIVSVVETRGDWLRISGSGNITGWVHRAVIWP